MAYARGKYALAISDRSGGIFPYSEMVKEWNGSFVHKSEFEAKHPQLEKGSHKVDPEAIKNALHALIKNKKKYNFLYNNTFKAFKDLKNNNFVEKKLNSILVKQN